MDAVNSGVDRAALIAAVAHWHDAGCAVHPAKIDGSKKPIAIEHGSPDKIEPVFPGKYQRGAMKGEPHPRAGRPNPKAGQYDFGHGRIMSGDMPPLTVAEVEAFIRDGRSDGIVVFCGRVSGGVFMLEAEGRAMDLMPSVREAAEVTGCLPLLERLETGCVDESPSGGRHFYLRAADGAVAGSEKLAMRANPAAETGREVLFETRGQGGLSVVAPSAGRTHKSGKPYRFVQGSPATIPTFTQSEIKKLLDVFRSVTEVPLADLSATLPANFEKRERIDGELLPGDDFNQRATWDEILVGWTKGAMKGARQHWTRPGKNDGTSATTTDDVLYVFSTSTGLPHNKGIGKFAAYAHLHHNGDFTAAARSLRDKGYGSRDVGKEKNARKETAQKRGNAVVAAAESHEPHSGATDLAKPTTLTDTGLARRLAKTIRGRLAYVRERETWIAWDGKRWAEHGAHATELAAKRLHDELWRELAELDTKPAEVVRFVKDSGHRARLAAAVALSQSEPGINVSWADFDKHPWLLNVRNGVLDLRSGDLLPHDPNLRITQLADVEYVPDAKSELWERFIREVTRGDEELEDFLAQAFGVALTGDVSDELLLCHRGDGCNGKTTCLEAISRMMGDYAAVAPPGMFASRNSESHPTEIAGLRGKRLITSSEQDADRTLRDSLIKTLTGGDTIRTRGMREDFWQMQPTWHIHLAYNREPRISGTDGGIRRRLRTVPWDASFEAAPDPTVKARLCSEDERPGILAWCLSGLRRRLAAGRLPYPAAVRVATEGYLEREDLIGRFIESCIVRAGPSVVVRVEDLAAACRDFMGTAGASDRELDGVDVRILNKQLGARGIRTERPNSGKHRKRYVACGVRMVAPQDDAAADRALNWAP